MKVGGVEGMQGVVACTVFFLFVFFTDSQDYPVADIQRQSVLKRIRYKMCVML